MLALRNSSHSRVVAFIVVLAMLLMYTFAFSTMAFAAPPSEAWTLYQNQIPVNTGTEVQIMSPNFTNVEKVAYVIVSAEFTYEGNVTNEAIKISGKYQGSHFDGKFVNSYISNTRAVAQYIEIYFDDNLDGKVDRKIRYINFDESAVGQGTLNIKLADAQTTEYKVDIKVEKTVKNVTDETSYNSSVTATIGDSIKFLVEVTNIGGLDATGLKISDLIPLSLIDALIIVSDGTYHDGLWTIGVLKSGDTVTLTMTGTIGSQPASPITNTASVSQLDQVDSNHNNNSSSATARIVYAQGFDLALTKIADESELERNDLVVFTITITNNGPEEALNVSISDTLPTGLNYVSDSAMGNYNSTTGVWTVGNLNATSDASIQITAQVDENAAYGAITNTAIWSGSDNDDTNNAASAVVTVVRSQQDPKGYDIAVTKVVDHASRYVNESVVFTVNVTNHGPDAAKEVAISDILPSGLTNIVVTTSVGIFLDSVWSIGTMLDGETATMTVAAIVTAVPGTVITNTATLIGDDSGENDDNNSDSATVTVISEGTEPDPDPDPESPQRRRTPVTIEEVPVPEAPAPEPEIVIVPEPVPLAEVPPQTGINDSVILYAAMLLGSLAGITALARRRKSVSE